MKRITILIYLLLLCFVLVGCTGDDEDEYQPSLNWERLYNGEANDLDHVIDMSLEREGNIVVTGCTTNDRTALDLDITTIKYGATGDLLWVQTFASSSTVSDEAVGLVIDQQNSIYVVGVSGNPRFSVLIKYSPQGEELWLQQCGDDQKSYIPVKVGIDAQDAVYVATSCGFVNEEDIYLMKYDPNGSLLWISSYAGSAQGSDIAADMVLDNSGNIIITGLESEFDQMNSPTDFVTLKYNPFGEIEWVKRYQGPAMNIDFATVIRCDGFDHIYVAGASEEVHAGQPEIDMALVKYDSQGNQLWSTRYDGGYGGDFPIDLALDGDRNLYLTGWSISQSNTKSCATIKYNDQGSQQWVTRYDGYGYYFNNPSKIACYNDQYIIISGIVQVNELETDWNLICYSVSGSQQWLQTYDGTGSSDDMDTPADLVLSTQGKIYVAGFTMQQQSDWDYTLLKYSDES